MDFRLASKNGIKLTGIHRCHLFLLLVPLCVNIVTMPGISQLTLSCTGAGRMTPLPGREFRVRQRRTVVNIPCMCPGPPDLHRAWRAEPLSPDPISLFSLPSDGWALEVLYIQCTFAERATESDVSAGLSGGRLRGQVEDVHGLIC